MRGGLKPSGTNTWMYLKTLDDYQPSVFVCLFYYLFLFGSEENYFYSKIKELLHAQFSIIFIIKLKTSESNAKSHFSSPDNA